MPTVGAYYINVYTRKTGNLHEYTQFDLGVWRWSNEEGASKDEKTLDFAFTQWSSSLSNEVLLTRVSDCDAMNYSPPSSSVHGILQGRVLELISLPLLQGIFPIPGSNQPLLPALQADSLPPEPPRKPKSV